MTAYEDARAARERVPYPERITAALDMADLYGPEVDEALGGEEPMVDEWETGERVPTVEQVRALARLTDVHEDYFYREPTDLGGPIFLCQRSGRGKGCRVVTDPHAGGPTVRAEAKEKVVPLHPETLF